MKKTKFFAYAGAIALVSIGFTSCSSEDEVANVNPTFDGDAVKTQFTITLPSNVIGTQTRMAVTTVQGQETPVFRGISEMTLIPFGTSTITSASTRLGDNIVLTPNALATDDMVKTAETATIGSSYAKVYEDVSIPLGTSGFLFYAKATGTPEATSTTATDLFTNGVLNTPVFTGEPSSFTFSPKQIYTSTSADTKANAICTYVTNIAKATGWANATNEGLKNLHINFIKLKAGSSATVQAAIQDLYTAIYKNTDDVSKAIANAITNSDYATAATDGTLTFKEAINGYPANINLPDGAAAIEWKTENTATPVITTASNNTGLNVAALARYVYPAGLYYRANSAVKVSNASQKDKYVTTNSWETILGNYKDGTSVTSTTRSVAINDMIQYAVGRLDMTVKAAADKLYDREGTEITLNASGFPVSAILIGGQKAVDFEFTNPTGDEYTIYDNALTGINATTTASSTNYTLALETAKDVAVNVAIELTNNTGADFVGADGIIPAGCKFYLVGQLTPSQGTGYVAGTLDKVFLQDYITKVDFTIQKNDGTAHDKGLGNAYNTIPDLRAPQLELGLAVNLKWQAGLTFNIEL